MATRSRHALTGCCSSTSSAAHAAHSARAGGGAAHPGAPLSLGPGRPAVHRRLGPGLFRARPGVASPIPSPRRSRTSSCQRSTTTTCACTSPCDDEARLAAIEAALIHGASLPGADGPLDISRALRWRETRTGFVGAGLPAAHQDVGGIPSGEPVAKRRAAVHGVQVQPPKEPGHRGRRHDPRRAVRAGHDDAGQLHAPASGQLVRRPEPASSGSRACTPPRSPPRRSAGSPPTPRATPTCSARRSAATA